MTTWVERQGAERAGWTPGLHEPRDSDGETTRLFFGEGEEQNVIGIDGLCFDINSLSFVIDTEPDLSRDEIDVVLRFQRDIVG